MADEQAKVNIKTTTADQITEDVTRAPINNQQTANDGVANNGAAGGGGDQKTPGEDQAGSGPNPNDPNQPIQPPIQPPGGGGPGGTMSDGTQPPQNPNDPTQKPKQDPNDPKADPNKPKTDGTEKPSDETSTEKPDQPETPVQPADHSSPDANNPASDSSPSNPAERTDTTNPPTNQGKTANRDRNNPNGGPAKPHGSGDGGKTAIRPRTSPGGGGTGAASAAGGKLGKVGAYANAAKDPKQAAKQLALDAAKKVVIEAVKKALMSALNAVIGFFGWWVLVGCIVIALICILIGIVMFAMSANGQFGKTYVAPSGVNSPDAKNLVSDSSTSASGSSTYTKFTFINSKDKEYVEQGKIDKRLLNALNYLAGKHKRIAVSHFVSSYIDMPNNPEAGDQLSKNVSAHVEGLAADVTEIDFVYKVLEYKEECEGTNDFDVVYYNDIDTELLRKKCAGNWAERADTNDTYKGGAKAIPIKVCWQDEQPDNNHLDLEDVVACTTQPSELYNNVFQPEARRKTHQVIDELLDYPYTTPSPDNYKVTQLITFSKERDVDPFKDKIDKLYGINRYANNGLFAMVESWTQVHVAY